MKKKKSNPLIYLKFAHDNDQIKPLMFKNPIHVIVAWTINDVMPSLKAVQQAVLNGNYAAGYVSYESAPAFNKDFNVNKDNQIPLLWFGIFHEPISGTIGGTSTPPNNIIWEPSITLDTYYENINKILGYIRDNKIQQVNYTLQLRSALKGDRISLYKQLEQKQSNYTAYMDTGDFTILSASPELFFHLKNGKITTKPMKGTIDRGKTYAEDLENAAWLKMSNKNRNENKMIVNLMKEELKKIAIPDSINISRLYDIEKYTTVYQMTSTVTAQLSPDITIVDIFKSLFPSGSITGLPKKESMDIITNLETDPREVYCGAIGYISPRNEAIFNVPIRTILMNNNDGSAQYGVGGAITKDSIKEEEYQEIVTKAKIITDTHPEFKLLESLGLCDGQYIVLDNHLKRLEQSAIYFNFKIDLDPIRASLNDIANKNNQGKWKVRLLINSNGEFTIETNRLEALTKELTTTLAKKPINKNNIFLYHKTTYRNMYETHQKVHTDLFDVLLWNEEGEITEFTMGNIVVELNGNLITPPIESGLLPGTYREVLLKEQIITEKKLTVEELNECQNIWFINSVRKWVSVNLTI